MTAATSIRLPWGSNETLALELPEGWNLREILEPRALAPAADPDAAVAAALEAPIASQPLRELARGARSVAILIDDLSRPTPAHLLLPRVIGELDAAGVARDGIVLVTTLGTHRPMTADDMARKIGSQWSGSLRWENHDHADVARNVHLGATSRGTPVYVNRTVAGSDVIVSLGVIEPHVIASFGGGYKNLIPGVAGARTIGATHTLNLTPVTFNMTGRPPEENPMRLDLEEAGEMLKKPFFIVNTILDSSLRIVRVVAGHPVAAHREGARTSAEMCGVRVDRTADVVITCSYPMDIDLRQGLKSLANTIRAVRPGGLIIALVRAVEGVGHMAGAKSRLGRGMLKALAPVLVHALPHTPPPKEGEEFKFFTYFGLQSFRRNEIVIYAPAIPKEFAAAVPTARFAWTIEEMWTLARRKFPGSADVLVFPAGGVTYPIV